MSRQPFSRPAGEYSTQSDEDSSDETEVATTGGETDYSDDDGKSRKRCKPVCNAACCCHMCYVCQFLCFMVVFPLWTKWLVTNPMPTQYWHEEYPKWPAIAAIGGQELAAESPLNYPIEMSPIPTSPESCNYSCSAWRGFRTAEMNFRVSLALNDSVLTKGYAHTVYPVLLASADFQDWWVVADRRFAYPSPFWRARTSSTGHAYNYFTDTCTRPPSSAVSASEQFTGSYILACVVWSPTAFAKISEMSSVKESELATLCNTVGGVCGWSCDSTIPSDRLPGCTADSTIEVTPTSVAGTEIPGADFKGNVEMRQCLNGVSDGKCDTATEKFKQWKCHKCMYDPTPVSEERRLQIPGIGDDMPAGLSDPDAPAGIPGIEAPAGIAGISGGTTAMAGKGGATIYTSLPRFRVTVSGTSLPEGTDVFSQPRTFILSSSMQTKGTWQKLYLDTVGKTKPPVPLNSHNKPVVQDTQDSESESLPVFDPVSKHAMSLNQQNRLEIEPGWCFGMQGPLYMVACAINSTTYSGDFEQFKAGQQAAPPPFNDRCMALSGRCGHACQPEQPSMPNCTADGHIIQTTLIGDVAAEKNQTTPVWLFCYVLLIGFAVKVVMLCPGVFSQYPHCRRYDSELTQQFRYIVVTIPTAGENKCVVLRNVIGAIGCMPKDCLCRYHVALVDEGHREEQKEMFMLLERVIEAIPAAGESFQENVREFFSAWTEDTKGMDLKVLKDGKKEAAAPDVLLAMSGKKTLAKILKEGRWARRNFTKVELKQLTNEDYVIGSKDASASPGVLDLLQENLMDFTSGVKKEMHLDSVKDWEGWKNKEKSTLLRLHYLARAKPTEDERTVKAQHVAPGIWYYNKPRGLEDDKFGNFRWMELRSKAKEMEYGLQDDGNFDKVPIRTSRGKAGGLNFVEMYLAIYADRHPYTPTSLEDHSSQDKQPYLFSICDARHQYQTDFFHTTIPYFFDAQEIPQLDRKVAFTQCPQFFAEMKDKCDYLDNNNAQFFRLNCMIRNCCGGVSSCGTNGTWAIEHEPFETVWHTEKKRVRDANKVRRYQYVERSIFHESCKVEDTASSLQRVLRGQHSQFINRRLSFGMAKNPVDYLAAVQRWAEGGVVLSLQTFFSYHEGVYMLWITFLFFIGFLISLIRLVNKDDTTWLVVQMHLVPQSAFDAVMDPVIGWVRSVGLVARSDYWKRHPAELDDFVRMTVQFIIWVGSLVLTMFIVFLFTETLKLVKRCCKIPFVFPNEMRWWGRMLISMDNLTYFLWFWTAFFWIGFNYYSVFTKRSYHFSSMGMFGFMLTVQILSWGMVIASSLRYTLATSMEANEVIALSMDNIWRSTQLFYITAPLLLYSLIKGAQDYSRYQLYGEDISYWAGGDRGVMSTNLVKYWTLLLILGAITAWIYYAIVGHKQVGVLGSCLIVSLIALDVLHPCTYLWVDKTKLPKEKTDKMTWTQALTTKGWYFSMLDRAVLNETTTGLVKWLGPAWFVAMPFLVLVLPYIGVNQAFMMIGSTTNR
eukprot:TRINITY_DN622_c0_g1_i3.p1 TRINITY_DN622_c0_g1~~TRINITY_DN622_c0_g1_i3.p1  ORF type:complete len:1537 (-),score=270.87 TRINITY_DN622_c0_g1_i3:83-4609(-)